MKNIITIVKDDFINLWKNHKKIITYSVVLLTLYILFLILTGNIDYKKDFNLESFDHALSIFQALGSLLLVVALVISYYSYKEQRRDIRQTKKEMKQQSKTFQLQLFQSTFTAMVEHFNNKLIFLEKKLIRNDELGLGQIFIFLRSINTYLGIVNNEIEDYYINNKHIEMLVSLINENKDNNHRIFAKSIKNYKVNIESIYKFFISNNPEVFRLMIYINNVDEYLDDNIKILDKAIDSYRMILYNQFEPITLLLYKLHSYAKTKNKDYLFIRKVIIFNSLYKNNDYDYLNIEKYLKENLLKE